MAEAQPPVPATEPRKWTHRWVTRRVNGDRYQALCRLIPKAFKNGWHSTYGFGSVVTVEFEDGTRVEASRIYVRRLGAVKPGATEASRKPRRQPVPRLNVGSRHDGPGLWTAWVIDVPGTEVQSKDRTQAEAAARRVARSILGLRAREHRSMGRY